MLLNKETKPNQTICIYIYICYSYRNARINMHMHVLWLYLTERTSRREDKFGAKRSALYAWRNLNVVVVDGWI